MYANFNFGQMNLSLIDRHPFSFSFFSFLSLSLLFPLFSRCSNRKSSSNVSDEGQVWLFVRDFYFFYFCTSLSLRSNLLVSRWLPVLLLLSSLPPPNFNLLNSYPSVLLLTKESCCCQKRKDRKKRSIEREGREQNNCSERDCRVMSLK